MSDETKTEKVVGVLGRRAFFRVLVWDKDGGKAKLMSRYGTEFVEPIDDLQRFGYVLTPGIQITKGSLADAKITFKRADGKPFDFPFGEF